MTASMVIMQSSQDAIVGDLLSLATGRRFLTPIV